MKGPLRTSCLMRTHIYTRFDSAPAWKKENIVELIMSSVMTHTLDFVFLVSTRAGL